jgi:hypothetical protein
MAYDNSNLNSHYVGINEVDFSLDLSLLYGEPGDFRDTWPVIPGKITFFVLFLFFSLYSIVLCLFGWSIWKHLENQFCDTPYCNIF